MDGEFELDPYFENLERPTDAETDEGLRRSLLEHGCIYPVVVWLEKKILIDGYRRVRLCGKDVPYRVSFKSFRSRAAAEGWVRSQQSERRNLDAQALAEARAKRRELIEEFVKTRIDPPTQVGTNSENVPTPTGGSLKNGSLSSVAKLAGVSRETVKRAARKAKAAQEAETPAVVVAAPDESREEDRLAQVFDEAIAAFKRAKVAVDAVWDATDDCRDFFHSSLKARLLGHISNANDCLKSIRPEVHHRCQGSGCEGCQQRGWVGKGVNQGER